MPDEPEAQGLLALMPLHDARRATRVDDAGDLVTLEHQDRGCWDTGEIAEGVDLLGAATWEGRPLSGAGRHRRLLRHRHGGGRHRLGAGRRAVWAVGSPGALPRSRAQPGRGRGHGRGPSAGLTLVEALDASEALSGYYLLPAVRADLFRRLDRNDEAAAAYRDARPLAATDTERRYLSRRPRPQKKRDANLSAPGPFVARTRMARRGSSRSSGVTAPNCPTGPAARSPSAEVVTDLGRAARPPSPC
jgi:RNA polymerase sigma-70 factor (ECF subfamily)